MVASSRCVELRLRMPAVRIQFVFLQQTAAGRRKIAEAEQEQLASWTRSFRYAGVDDERTLNVNVAFL